MDVCPVGAITTRDYRFKSRPWDNPGVADTICTLCSKGCNTSAWLKANSSPWPDSPDTPDISDTSNISDSPDTPDSPDTKEAAR